MALLAGKGAVHVTLPPELPRSAIAALIEKAGELKLTLEVQVHGRMPLALSARCYHARAHGLNRDSCRYVCDRDPDGMLLRTLDGKPFLVINGVQTLSYTCLNLVQEMNALADAGVDAFRISPQSSGTVEAARIFHCCLKGQMTADEALIRLGETEFDAPFANGFHHGAEGHQLIGLLKPCPHAAHLVQILELDRHADDLARRGGAAIDALLQVGGIDAKQVPEILHRKTEE